MSNKFLPLVAALMFVFSFTGMASAQDADPCAGLTGARLTICQSRNAPVGEVPVDPTATPPAAGAEEVPAEGEAMEEADVEAAEMIVVEDAVTLEMITASTDSLNLRWMVVSENPLEGFLADANVLCEGEQPTAQNFNRPLGFNMKVEGEFELDGLPSDAECWVGVGVQSEDGTTEYQGQATFKTGLPELPKIKFPKLWLVAMILGSAFFAGQGIFQPSSAPARPSGTSSRP